MVNGETSRYPLSFFVKIRMVMYWTKILTANEIELVVLFYQCYTDESFVHSWIKCVGDIYFILVDCLMYG